MCVGRWPPVYAIPMVTFVSEFRLRHARGHWIWVLARGKIMNAEIHAESLCIAGIMMDISARKVMEAALLSAARQDKLTGLANRAVFTEVLEKARLRVQHHTQSRLTVLFLDFDRFKLVNDTLGHRVGDELLRQIAKRLRHTVGGTDPVGGPSANLISRFGGDEFLILLNDQTNANDAIAMAERLLDALTPPYDVDGAELHSLASIGIVSTGRSNATTEEIIRNADVAMYEAKRAGRGCYVLFDETMHARLSRHVSIDARSTSRHWHAGALPGVSADRRFILRGLAIRRGAHSLEASDTRSGLTQRVHSYRGGVWADC